jgi:hypothetical protein
VGDQEQTSTRRPKGCLHWQMVWWVKGLMNHPILKAETNVGLICTHTRERGSIKVEQNSCRREYATVIKECSMERKSFAKGTEARGSNTTITTPTPYVSRTQEKTSTKRPKGCLCWKLVWWVKGLMNHPILKVATNVGLLRTHTMVRGNIKVERNSRRQEYATIFRECRKERQSFTKRTEA